MLIVSPNKVRRQGMCRWASLLVLMGIIGFSGTIFAQTRDEQRCLASDPDLSISGCTAAIQSGQETQEDRAVAFYNRGVSYGRKGQHDRAI